MSHSTAYSPSKIALITLGCPKNDVDAETMAGLLQREGFEIVSSLEAADTILINTCGFIESARAESIEAVMKAVRHKQNTGKKLYVWGCLSERYMDVLKREIPEVDGFFGVEPFDTLPAQLLGSLPVKPENPFRYRLLSTPPHTAYLKIADGCDHLCTFCAIPLIKGKYRSRRPESILEETKILAGRGVQELILIAQDTTAYGHDLHPETSLVDLLDSLVSIRSIKWIRILYGHPAHISDDLINFMADEEKMCRYIDLPLQHISDPVLKAMGRGMSRNDITGLLGRIRSRIPDVTLRTTFITGFPGETRAHFNELLDFIRETGFERLGAFAYSPEPGTHAGGLKKRVAKRIARARFRKIMQEQRQISAALNQGLVGSTIPVLIDGYDERKECFAGRSEGDAPAIDQMVWVRGNVTAGQIVSVNIEEASDYDLIGSTCV